MFGLRNLAGSRHRSGTARGHSAHLARAGARRSTDAAECPARRPCTPHSGAHAPRPSHALQLEQHVRFTSAIACPRCCVSPRSPACVCLCGKCTTHRMCVCLRAPPIPTPFLPAHNVYYLTWGQFRAALNARRFARARLAVIGRPGQLDHRSFLCPRGEHETQTQDSNFGNGGPDDIFFKFSTAFGRARDDRARRAAYNGLGWHS